MHTTSDKILPQYRGRLAPSPTGFLHLGHARTFWTAQKRARENDGVLALRNEDLDATRSKAIFTEAMLEDLHWFGLKWQEGPDCGGWFGPYSQSARHSFYLETFEKLRAANLIYPCTCSRKDLQFAAHAPHADDDDPVYPGTCRTNQESPIKNQKYAWRFRVPDGEIISFFDGYFGAQNFIAGKDFGDFVIWRREQLPSYQLAVVVDDAAMRITEVVRGKDLLVSTARQILLYQTLGWTPPQFFHCPLMTDENGVRLAKRHEALSLRELRAQGFTPENLRKNW